MKKSVIGSAVILGIVAAAFAPLAGCGSTDSGSSGGSPVAQGPHVGQGEIGVDLTIPGGETITTVNWTITSGTTVVLSGTYSIPDAATGISFFIPNVPSGSGYVLNLTSASPDGLVTCVGTSAPFSVTAQTTTNVNVFLVCSSSSSATDAGGVQVNVTPTECASWTSVSATPATQTAGNNVSLTASAVAPNPAAITYLWTASAGTIANATSALATFTCPAAPGVETITLAVTDGTLPAGATCPAVSSSTTVTVTCGAVPCVGIGNGIEVTGDSATGTCTSGINTGTLQDSSGNFCCSPTPCVGVGNGVEVTGNSATGACTSGVNSGTLKDSSGNFCCSALAPCTTAGQTGCVACQGSTGGVCTPTEAVLVSLDISKGAATAAGNDPAAGCYTCLLGKHALDDTTGDVGNECGDLGTTGSDNPTTCLATMNCITSTACALFSSYPGSGLTANNLGDCYCGTLAPTGSCTTATTGLGACAGQEAAELGLTVGQGLAIQQGFTSAQANVLLQAGLTANACPQCLQ